MGSTMDGNARVRSPLILACIHETNPDVSVFKNHIRNFITIHTVEYEGTQIAYLEAEVSSIPSSAAQNEQTRTLQKRY